MIPFQTKQGEKVNYRPGNGKPENGIFVGFSNDGISAYVVYNCNKNLDKWREYGSAITPTTSLYPGHVDDLPGGFYVGEKIHDKYSGENGVCLGVSDQNKYCIITSIQYKGINQHYNPSSLNKGWYSDVKLQYPKIIIPMKEYEKELQWPF